MPRPTAFYLDLDWAHVRSAYERAGVLSALSAPGSKEEASPEELRSTGHALAHAIATSPGWKEFPPGVVVFRDGPQPLLGILFEDRVPDTASLEVRAAQLPLSLELLRFRDWEDVTEDAAVVADILRAELGEDEARRARWIGIPRGGRIVLGLLSYLLDLPPTSPAVDGAPIVVVDDCILSGRRLREQLSTLDANDRVIVATLFSHPAVREAVAEQEPAVEGIFSAHDLEDHSDEVYADDADSWKERWSDRSDAEGVWIGLPDHICFPWNEPDVCLWNGRREVVAWRVLPSDVCLKNRLDSEGSLGVSVMSCGSGYLAPAAGVLTATVEDGLVVADRNTARSIRLSDSAAHMWHALTAEPDRSSAVALLSERFGVEGEEMHRDVEAFEGQLVDLGLVERRR